MPLKKNSKQIPIAKQISKVYPRHISEVHDQ